jgi:two-component system, cell cycle sensor histidine kinase and response regulator CckA
MILVIDDEAHIREVVRETLDFVGIATLTAASGHEGLAIFTAHQTEIEAVILDLKMADMDGRETLRQLRSLSPTLPVIVASGIGEIGLATEFRGETGVLHLAKPFSLESLIATVQQARGG